MTNYPHACEGVANRFFCETALCVAVVVFAFAVSREAGGAAPPWRPGNRIAISADGNPDADRDDLGATPMTLAVLAKAGQQDSLVHYDFNNWLEYKRIPAGKNGMWEGAMGGQSRWGFDRTKFFDAATSPQKAISNLAVEISKSTKENPLFIVVAGPMELIYQAMVRARAEAWPHVTLVSHSGYNEYFRPRLWHRNLDDVLTLAPAVTLHRIPDQNVGLRTVDDYAPWRWLRDHPDGNLRWVYSRMQAGLPDVSDAGMVSWLTGVSGDDDVTTVSELASYFKGGSIPGTADEVESIPPAPAGVDPEIRLPKTEHVFQETEGKIVIEAECVPLTGDWVIERSEPGYTGQGYIRYLPQNINAIHPPSRGVLVFKLRVLNPGSYRLALKHSHRGAPARDKWNDVWTLMGINPAPYGNIRKTYHSVSEAEFSEGIGFTFGTTHDNYGAVAKRDGHFSKPIYNLGTGDHYFFIAGRSGGYRLDKIHFFKEGVNGFMDDSIPATPVLASGD